MGEESVGAIAPNYSDEDRSSRGNILTNSDTKEYFPPKMEVLKQYSISIQFHDVGCIVQVGCKSVAFNTIESAMEAINTYVKDPYMEQQKWQKIFQ